MKEKGIKIMLSIFLLASILMPFSVSADSITTSNILSVNKTLLDVENVEIKDYGGSNTHYYTYTNIYTYNFHFVFDYSYLGWINIQPKTSYDFYYYSSGNVVTQNRTYEAPAKTYYVSGNTLDITVSFRSDVLTTTGGNQDPSQQYIAQYLLNSSSLTKYSDLTNVESVISILDEINQYISIDILDELQSIVSNTSLSNDYLDLISQIRQYNFPIESLPFILKYCNEYRINSGEYKLLDWPVIYRYQYPIFKVIYSGSYFELCTLAVYKDKPVDIVFWVSTNQGPSTINNYIFLNDTNNFQFDLVERITTTDIWTLEDSSTSNNKVMALYHFKVSYIGSNIAGQVRLRTNINPLYIIPIFYGVSDYCSTDFCLNYGLQNQIMKNLNIIAQGTHQSQQAGSDLDDATSDMQSDFNSYYSIENTANSDFNSALNGINFNDQIAGNQSFLDSASFVKTVFSSMMQIPILSTFVIILCIILMARIFL